MKILHLKTENVLNLKAIEITPEGNAVILTGPNGAGKSAVLDSIFYALTGKRPEQLIRQGEKKAQVEVEMEDYIVKRVCTEKSERLEVLSKDGSIYKSPQAILNKLIGNLSFDPLAFKLMEPRAQKELLSKLVGLDFSTVDAERKDLYDKRTIVGRDVTRLESVLKTLPLPEAGLPEKEISISEQIAVIDHLETVRKEYQAYVDKVADIDRRIQANWDEVARLDNEIQRIKAKQTELIEAIGTLTESKTALSEPAILKDGVIQEERKKLSTIEETNRKIRNAQSYKKAEADLKDVKIRYDVMTEAIQGIDNDKADRVKKAQYPIEGLSITDDGVSYTGIPFKQLSTGQAIRVSTAIAMALNPDLRVIMIRDASLLDTAGMEEVISLAKEKDYQLWLEKVSDGGAPGIYIESGEIKEAVEVSR